MAQVASGAKQHADCSKLLTSIFMFNFKACFCTNKSDQKVIHVVNGALRIVILQFRNILSAVIALLPTLKRRTSKSPSLNLLRITFVQFPGTFDLNLAL